MSNELTDALARLERVDAMLSDIECGEHATSGRQFGQGMAHAAKLIRQAMDGPEPQWTDHVRVTTAAI